MNLSSFKVGENKVIVVRWVVRHCSNLQLNEGLAKGQKDFRDGGSHPILERPPFWVAFGFKTRLLEGTRIHSPFH